MAREELGDHLEALLAAASTGAALDAAGGADTLSVRSKLREVELRTYDANAFSQTILGFENVSMN